MKNDLSHLNDRLHEMLDAVADPTDDNGDAITDEELRLRIARAGAVSAIAGQIIATGRLALEGERLRSDHPDADVPRLINAAARPRVNGQGGH